MVPIDKVLFRQHDGADVCEIHLPDGNNVPVFPANEVVAGSDPAQTYAECYRAAFDAYKAGNLQPFEVAAQEAAAANTDTEHRGAVSDVETAQSGDRAGRAERLRQPKDEPQPAKVRDRKPGKAKAAKKSRAPVGKQAPKKATAKKPAKKAAKAKKK